MNAADKPMMDRDETTVVLFVCTDTIKLHDITREAHRAIQHSNQLLEHAGIVDKCKSEEVIRPYTYTHFYMSKRKRQSMVFKCHFQEVSFTRKEAGDGPQCF